MTQGKPPVDESLTQGLNAWTLDGGHGPAKAATKDEMEGMLENVLADWAEEQRPAAGGGAATEPRRGRRGMVGWGAAAGLVVGFLLAGSMAAALVVLMRPDASDSPPTRSAPPEESTEPALVPPPVPSREETREAPESAGPEETSMRRGPSATDQLAAANEARRGRRFARAARLYRSLAASDGPEAYPAAVAAGSLYLEHLRRPQSAVRSFRRALRLQSSGPLDLTVREGLARAYRQQGAQQNETDALEAIVSRHPRSNAAGAARARLRELSAGE